MGKSNAITEFIRGIHARDSVRAEPDRTGQNEGGFQRRPAQKEMPEAQDRSEWYFVLCVCTVGKNISSFARWLETVHTN